MIYFVQEGPGGLIQIGMTNDLEATRRAIQSHAGTEVRVLATMPGDIHDLGAWLGRFAQNRIGPGDRYLATADLIEALGLQGPKLQAVPRRFDVPRFGGRQIKGI